MRQPTRPPTGIDRAADKQAFAKFLDDKRYSANQIRFVEIVVNYLTDHGTVDPGRIYESPFTSVAPEGPEAIPPDDVNEFFQIVKHFHDTAVT